MNRTPEWLPAADSGGTAAKCRTHSIVAIGTEAAPFVPRAVALAYQQGAGDTAPRVRARGQGAIAEEIIRRARAAGVFVHASPELVSLLMQIDLDRQIPPQLYQAIAGLLAWIYRIEEALPHHPGRTATAAP